MRTTAEAFAIALVGVGALFSILAPKLMVAKEETENKALIGPSADRVTSDLELEGGLRGGIVVSCSHVSRGSNGGGGGSNGGGNGVEVGELSVGAPSVTGTPSSSAATGLRKKTPRGGAAQVVPVGMVGSTPTHGRMVGSTPTHSRNPSRSDTPSSAAARTRSASRPNSPLFGKFGEDLAGDKDGAGGAVGGKGDVEQGKHALPPAGFCTPPSHAHRNRGASLSGDTESVDANMSEKGRSSRMNSGSSAAAKKDRALSAAASFLLERRSGGGGSNSSKPPLSGMSGGSARSSARGKGRGSTRKSMVGVSSKRGGSSGGSGGGGGNGKRNQTSVVKDSWTLDPLTLALNGDHAALYRGGGTGESGSTTVSAATLDSRHSRSTMQSLSGKATSVTSSRSGSGSRVDAARRTIKRRASSGSVRAAKWRDRDRSSSSVSAGGRKGGGGAGQRSSAAGSLKMFADSGTRLFCPHCEKEVRERGVRWSAGMDGNGNVACQ